MRRPRATEESKARAARIARALAGLLPDEPASAAPRSARGGSCPACGASLVASGAAHGVEIDACTGCGGIWLDVGELERLTADVASREDGEGGEVAPRRRGADEEVRYRECPRCREVMLRRNFGTTSGVIVDECARHGLFLDAGELQAIEAFLRAQARAMPPAPPMSTSAPGRGRVAGEVVWDRLFRR